jgi:hypothetical protein
MVIEWRTLIIVRRILRKFQPRTQFKSWRGFLFFFVPAQAVIQDFFGMVSIKMDPGIRRDEEVPSYGEVRDD